MSSITAGAVRTTEAQKKAYAKESHAFNLKSKKFRVSCLHLIMADTADSNRMSSLMYVIPSIPGASRS